MKMKHYISSENCEKEIKEILCVPEKENVLLQMGLSMLGLRERKKLIDSKVVVNERKIQ
jgi:hypothetical protein